MPQEGGARLCLLLCCAGLSEDKVGCSSEACGARALLHAHQLGRLARLDLCTPCAAFPPRPACRSQHYGQRWRRPASGQLTKTMRDKVAGYRGNLMQVGVGLQGCCCGGWRPAVGRWGWRLAAGGQRVEACRGARIPWDWLVRELAPQRGTWRVASGGV